ncbi:MAG: YgiQ family radical SAM protein, partial [Nitrospinota bacterium]|nr:YgiQ family radical SAM protein [Nitrospinota bacterium]
MTEARSRGWKQLDVILISGDAYVDHPSFGVALVGRHLESLGVKVGVIAAPNINNPEEFTALGKPKWFFGVTSGNLDSMLMHMTASKKRRNNDDYVPENFSAIRPRRAVIAYCNKLRELYDRPPILIGGIEASLRRFAHYDYWDNKVRRSILFDARADMLVYGMAENPLNKIIQLMKKGKRLTQLRNIKGTSIILNKKECEDTRASSLEIHSFDELQLSKNKYSNASKIINKNLSPYNAKTILQSYGNRYLCVYPPSMPLAENELDRLYDLPFTRLPHSKYKEKIAAYEMIKFSITALRGCFGGCTFCSLSAHQGKEVQSRSVG